MAVSLTERVQHSGADAGERGGGHQTRRTSFVPNNP